MKDILYSARQELLFPGAVGIGARGMPVRRLQEWLSFQKFSTPIDGNFGDATAHQLNACQTSMHEPLQPTLSDDLWVKLTAPLAQAIAPLALQPGESLSDLVLRVAQQHYASRPIELGGENSGPWVRAYMDGNDGTAYPWCAGFVTLVVAQACQQLGSKMPVLRTYSCDALAVDARNNGRLIALPKQVDWPTLGDAQIFLVQQAPNTWSHTGFAFGGAGPTFSTIEGNSNENGSNEGYEVVERRRSIDGKCIIRLD